MNLKNRLAQYYYGKDWDNITTLQRIEIINKHQRQFDHLYEVQKHDKRRNAD